MVALDTKPPSRHKLSGVLLKRVRDQIRRENVIKLINEHPYMSIVTDVNSSRIINFMVVAPGMPSLFWSSRSTRSEQHTALYIAGDIENVIADVERETTAQVIKVVIENAKKYEERYGSHSYQAS
ncbi:hypothetical protein F441_22395 [Phytophthora nicotianae CJ01A1]|uniref:Uncharacterized protein n=2 Tax=Phytophthora nicotianae TaxID=4792 RepID=W2VPL0_PHYNI|nr:hypothetical protein L916_16334 [Phytophthora nicotianae]ETP00185.1 hypothetical protein F441_22395 [Phytophthora nicotianae CJ01A1]